MPLNKGKIIEKNNLTEDVLELKLETPTPLQFIAGQYISIKVMDKPDTPCFRAYSIASPPGKNPLELCIKIVESGRASEWLKSLEVNSEIEFLGPIGKFVFEEHTNHSLFIATGTGVAPFKAIIEDELIKNSKKEMTLIFGVRYIKDIFYQELFQELAEKHPNFHFELTLSRPEADWKGHKGRVTDLIQQTSLNPNNSKVYICGLKDMIESVTNLLQQKGFPSENIHFEKYD